MDNIITSSPKNISVDRVLFHKMSFIYNALQSGWEIKMNDDKYSSYLGVAIGLIGMIITIIIIKIMDIL